MKKNEKTATLILLLPEALKDDLMTEGWRRGLNMSTFLRILIKEGLGKYGKNFHKHGHKKEEVPERK